MDNKAMFLFPTVICWVYDGYHLCTLSRRFQYGENICHSFLPPLFLLVMCLPHTVLTMIIMNDIYDSSGIGLTTIFRW